jgi:hypothetical protein
MAQLNLLGLAQLSALVPHLWEMALVMAQLTHSEMEQRSVHQQLQRDLQE